MSLTVYQVDAFTNQPFRGNPAGVCILANNQEDDWLQKVAAEMYLPETAFVTPKDDGYALRWFTPKTEVELCGHATLATAHVLYETGLLDRKLVAKFWTRSGLLTATAKAEGWIELDFPAKPISPAEAPAGMLAALGVKAPLFVGRNKALYLVEVADEEALRGLRPDPEALAKTGAMGTIVTCGGREPYDFVSRFFDPAVGIPEDPVTGMAHCALGVYWQGKLRQHEFLAYQASQRGGVIRVSVEGDRIHLAGQATTVMKCDFLLKV